MNSLFSLVLRALLVPELFFRFSKNFKKKFPDLVIFFSDLLDLFLFFLIYALISRSTIFFGKVDSNSQELNDRDSEEGFSSIRCPEIAIPDRSTSLAATIFCYFCGRIAHVLKSCIDEKIHLDLQLGEGLRADLARNRMDMRWKENNDSRGSLKSNYAFHQEAMEEFTESEHDDGVRANWKATREEENGWIWKTMDKVYEHWPEVIVDPLLEKGIEQVSLFSYCNVEDIEYKAKCPVDDDNNSLLVVPRYSVVQLSKEFDRLVLKINGCVFEECEGIDATAEEMYNGWRREWEMTVSCGSVGRVLSEVSNSYVGIVNQSNRVNKVVRKALKQFGRMVFIKGKVNRMLIVAIDSVVVYGCGGWLYAATKEP